jgi:hypothetical protein
MNLDFSLTYFSGIAFIIYGLLILFTTHMKAEFERYQMKQLRTLTGVLETLGGLGSIIGLYFSKEIYLISTGGLFLLMFLGIIVRLKIKDEFIKILPAIILLVLNGYLFFTII